MSEYDDEYTGSPDEQDVPSKSARKREMHALQQLGADIVALSAGQLATIPLDAKLAEAIDTARRIKSREGLRRQMQYIGKLMRSAEVEPIREALRQLEHGRKEDARRFHQLEQWRDQLLEQGPKACEEVMAHFPQADGQHLRQLISRANKEKQLNKPPTSARKLFRYLRELDEQAAGEA